MSGMEIERKFLVRDSSYKQQARSSSHIRQGYICSGHGRTVRVRLRDDEAFLTIKGPSLDGGLSRYEFETAIDMNEAVQLMQLCEPGIIDKTRYLVDCGTHTFEVDEFHGDNDGLVIAEVEFDSVDEANSFIGPDWFVEDVTSDKKYHNSYLSKLDLNEMSTE